jgi:hypothetical protein
MDSGPLRPGAGGEMVGTSPPPIENQPNRVGVDPHGLGGDTAEIRRLVAGFLRPGGALQPGCDGGPCYIGDWTGP